MMFQTVGELNSLPKESTLLTRKPSGITSDRKRPTLSWLESLRNSLPKSSRRSGTNMNVLLQQKVTCRTCGKIVAIREGFAGFPIQTIYRNECECPTNTFRIDVRRSTAH